MQKGWKSFENLPQPITKANALQQGITVVLSALPILEKRFKLITSLLIALLLDPSLETKKTIFGIKLHIRDYTSGVSGSSIFKNYDLIVST